jgi:hypothetical protein
MLKYRIIRKYTIVLSNVEFYELKYKIRIKYGITLINKNLRPEK